MKAKPVEPSAPVLVTVRNAASLTSLSYRTIQTLIAAGSLPSRKIGGRRLVLYRALLDFCEHDQPVVGRTTGRGADAQIFDAQVSA